MEPNNEETIPPMSQSATDNETMNLSRSSTDSSFGSLTGWDDDGETLSIEDDVEAELIEIFEGCAYFIGH